MKIERREFLKLLGGATGAVVLGGFGLDQMLEVPDHVVEQLRRGPGIETWRSTICGMCPGGCGLKTRLIDGVPVYLKGNPDFPVNLGGMCPLGHASLEGLFNPDRIQTPMRRIGPPGAGRFERVDWSDALRGLAGQLRALRDAGRSHEVAFLGWPDGAVTEEVVRRFMRAYGSPNVFLNPERAQDSVPYRLTEGRSGLPAYDVLNARTILSLGSNFLEEEYAPVHYTKLFSNEPEGLQKTLIHAGPRLGLTGAKAHRWLPARPGTYGALALGLAHVLVREELHDARFVREHTFGFDDWTDDSGGVQQGFRSMILADYFPERVAEMTGVPSEAILEVARMLGIDTPSLVVGGAGVSQDRFGTFGQMAVHSLNALLGNIGREGGLFWPTTAPLTPLPAFEIDTAATSGIARPTIGTVDSLPLSRFSVDAFTENVLAGHPYPIQVLFVLGGNPVFESIRHHDLVEALRRIPLVVSFDPFLNETSEFAGLILPDHTFLEKWDVVTGVPSVGTAHVGLRQPVIDPVFDSRQAADVIGDLARAVGPEVAAADPFSNQQERVRHAIQGLYDSGIGAISTVGVREIWLEYLQQRGWHMGQYDSSDAFWGELLEHGGWWNPVRNEALQRQFDTPSGRFEFFSQSLLDSMGGARSIRPDGSNDRLDAIGVGARGSAAFMPHAEESDESGDALHLLVFGSLTTRNGNGANLPLMQEQFGMAAHRPWTTWLEIHPETAERHGIVDGDWVRLESSIGSIRVRSRIVPSISPDCVGVPFGQGHTSFGRYARYVGVNPHAIVRALYDPLSGRAATQSTLVTIVNNA